MKKNLSNPRFLPSLLSLASLLSLFTLPAWAASPYRLGDLNTAPGSPLFTVPVPPTGFISLGNKALFSTADPRTGDEGILWSTDGTARGRVAISSSLSPAPCQGIRPRAVWHGLALLQVSPGSAPPYLLRSDGTPAGTFPLAGGPVGTIQA